MNKFLTELTVLWRFLNGRKTVIGAFCGTLAGFLSQVVVGIWGVEGPWVVPTIDTLLWFTMAFGGTGLVHKGVKMRTTMPTDAPDDENSVIPDPGPTIKK